MQLNHFDPKPGINLGAPMTEDPTKNKQKKIINQKIIRNHSGHNVPEMNISGLVWCAAFLQKIRRNPSGHNVPEMNISGLVWCAAILQKIRRNPSVLECCLDRMLCPRSGVVCCCGIGVIINAKTTMYFSILNAKNGNKHLSRQQIYQSREGSDRSRMNERSSDQSC